MFGHLFLARDVTGFNRSDHDSGARCSEDIYGGAQFRRWSVIFLGFERSGVNLDRKMFHFSNTSNPNDYRADSVLLGQIEKNFKKIKKRLSKNGQVLYNKEKQSAFHAEASEINR